MKGTISALSFLHSRQIFGSNYQLLVFNSFSSECFSVILDHILVNFKMRSSAPAVEAEDQFCFSPQLSLPFLLVFDTVFSFVLVLMTFMNSK